jgi:hypothetical protein
MKVSIIIASRLQPRFGDGTGCLWLDRALRSVGRQAVGPGVELEIVVGLDPGVVFPERIRQVVAVHANQARQASALNAAVSASGGELLAILEDDDYWEPNRIPYGLRCIEHYDLVTTNQREVDEDGSFVALNDYPTPSGWLLRREAWDRVGPFDEAFTFVDSDWLGRANASGLRRLHLVEAGAPRRAGIANVARFSAIGHTAERDPLVLRTANPHGVVGTARRERAAHLQHQQDIRRLVEQYGDIPW